MKHSAIMVALRAPIARLEPSAREYLRWFLTEFMQGINPEHTKRWLRQVHRLWRDGGIWTFYPVVERHGRYHRMHMVVEQRVYEHQDGFVQLKAFRLWLKTGAVFGAYEPSPTGGLVFVPSSLSYEDCSDDEMREFHADALEYLRTPHALATLWPAVPPEKRHEQLEAVLNPPTEDE